MPWLTAFERIASFSAALSAFACSWLLQSTALILVGLLAASLLRRKGAACASAVYRAVLAAVLVCPAMTLALQGLGMPSLISWPGPFTPHEKEASTPIATEKPALPSVDATFLAAAPYEWTPLPEARPASYVPPPKFVAEAPSPVLDAKAEIIPAAPPPSPPIPWPLLGASALACAWFAISGILLIRLAFAWRRAARLRQTASPVDGAISRVCESLAARIGVRAPAVLQSPFLSSPVLIGLREPSIVLPEETCELEHFKEVFIHELAHLARGDIFWKLLAHLSTVALFFQPLLWLLVRRLANAAEEVCDDYVVRFGCDRTGYVRRLVEIAEQHRPLPVSGVGIISLRSTIRRRIERILDTSRRLSTRLGRRTAILVTLTSMAAASLAGLLAFGGEPSVAPPRTEQAKELPKKKAASPQENAAKEKSQSVIEGYVLDNVAKPIAGAQVALMLRRIEDGAYQEELTLETTSDQKGFFHFSPPNRKQNKGKETFFLVSALAPGYGVAMEYGVLFPARQEYQLQLDDERPAVGGRLLDAEDRPVAGVAVRLRSLSSLSHDSTATLAKGIDFPDVESRALPQAAVTDTQGRFYFRNVGREYLPPVKIEVEVDEPQLDPKMEGLKVVGDPPGMIQAKIMPMVKGVITRGDVGTPLPGARVCVTSYEYGWHGSGYSCISSPIWNTTDARGRYHVRYAPYPNMTIRVEIPRGEPYLGVQQKITNYIHATKIQNVTVPRGVMLRGKVVEEGSGKPLTNIPLIYFQPAADKPQGGEFQVGNQYSGPDFDGRFQIVVPPGPGFLRVGSYSQEYLPQAITWGELKNDPTGFLPDNPDLHFDEAPRLDREPEAITIKLHRSATIQGKIIGPQGETVPLATMIGWHDRNLGPEPQRGSVQDGKFTIGGCDPARNEYVLVLDEQHQWGAAVDFDVRQAQNETPVIRLAPCGSASVVFTELGGAPYANCTWEKLPFVDLQMQIIPEKSTEKKTVGESSPSELSFFSNRYSRRYFHLLTDVKGRLTLPDLIPGVRYRLSAGPPQADGKKELLKSFSVKAGATIDLGTLVLKRPREDNRQPPSDQ